MKDLFKTGDIKIYTKIVTQAEIAQFDSGIVHELYSTFSIARDAEWASRLFVLEMKDEDEEGIGTFVNIQHVAPALPGSEIIITATFLELRKNEVICSFEAKHKERLIAKGSTGQKILQKQRLENLLAGLQS